MNSSFGSALNSLGSNDTLNDDSKAIMTYKDKSIYNLLQPSRKVRKQIFSICNCIKLFVIICHRLLSGWEINLFLFLQPTYGSLELKEADKRAVFQKTGPCPQWYSRWRTREFALKDNFLYYYKTKVRHEQYMHDVTLVLIHLWYIHDFHGIHVIRILFLSLQKTDRTTVLGAVYIRGAAIEQEKIKGCKNVLVITPPVPRRVGWKDDETSIFYINFKTAALRSEVS